MCIVNGKSQPTNVQADTLTETIRTNVPFKIGQRNKTAPLSGASIQDVRVYARRLADGEVASLAQSALSAVVAAPPEKRSQADLDSLYDWWLTSLDDKYQTTIEEARMRSLREQADIQARSTTGYVMQEKPEPPIAYVLNRGEYDQRKEQGLARHARDAAALPCRFAAQSAGAWPSGCCGPSIRSPPASPSIASGAKSSAPAWSERPATSASPANCRRIQNCSIGWPSSSANRAGTSRSCSS